MARKNDIRYIQFYTDGSAARKLEPKQTKPRRKVPRPRQRRQSEWVLSVDFAAVGAVVLALLLAGMLGRGLLRLHEANQYREQMRFSQAETERRNQDLRQAYSEQIDLAAVEKTAKDMGLVPVEQSPAFSISPAPEQTEEPETDIWQRIAAFLQDLFA